MNVNSKTRRMLRTFIIILVVINPSSISYYCYLLLINIKESNLYTLLLQNIMPANSLFIYFSSDMSAILSSYLLSISMFVQF